MTSINWKLLETLARVENQWISLIGERLIDEQGQSINYWRVERSDSVIVIPVHRQQILLPKPFYRHGVGLQTYDFPGGRHNGNKEPVDTAYQVLHRELKVKASAVDHMTFLNPEGWLVDSSFSSQKVFAFEAHISEDASVSPEVVDISQPANRTGAAIILEKLNCLQCRCALMEWIVKNIAV